MEYESENSESFAPKHEHNVLVLHNLSLSNLLRIDLLTINPFVNVSYKGANKQGPTSIIDTNPFFRLNFVFPTDWSGDIEITIYYKHLLNNLKLGTITISEGELAELKKPRNIRKTIVGNVTLTSNAEVARNLQKKSPPEYKIVFYGQYWSCNYEGTNVSKGNLDKFTKVLFESVRKEFDETGSVDTSKIKPPVATTNELKWKQPIDTLDTLRIPTLDDNFNTPVIAAFQNFAVNQLTAIKPLRDNDCEWSSRASGVEYVQLQFGKYLMDPIEDMWDDLTSDHALTRFFFAGLGACLLTPIDSGYHVNVDFLQKYSVRKGYERYRGQIFFNSACAVTKIVLEKTYLPGNEGWEEAKFIIRTTVTELITIREHLMQVHLTWANWFAVTPRHTLNPDHPVNRLVIGHTYRTAKVNTNSSITLLVNEGILHRASGFDATGLFDCLSDSYSAWKFQTFPESVKDIDTPNWWYAVDGLKYHAIIQKYVSAYLDVFYDSEDLSQDTELQTYWKALTEHNNVIGLPPLTLSSLKQVLGEVIFRVSGWHNHVGNVLALVLDPGCVGYKKGPKHQLMATPQRTYFVNLIAIGTSMQMPMMLSDWTHLFLKKNTEQFEKTKAIHAQLQKELNNLADEIDQRNDKGWIYNAYNPRHMQMGVSI